MNASEPLPTLPAADQDQAQDHHAYLSFAVAAIDLNHACEVLGFERFARFVDELKWTTSSAEFEAVLEHYGLV